METDDCWIHLTCRIGFGSLPYRNVLFLGREKLRKHAMSSNISLAYPFLANAVAFARTN